MPTLNDVMAKGEPKHPACEACKDRGLIDQDCPPYKLDGEVCDRCRGQGFVEAFCPSCAKGMKMANQERKKIITERRP